MKRETRLPELLAPAGSFECLIAAIRGGADAIYVGGKRFGARAYAKNFDTEEMKKAVIYAHLHGRKIYVTINTLILDREMEDALAYARELYRIGVDALIVADLGLIRVLREHLPELELHGSTQMSAHNTLGADMAYELGCKRVVLARELSGENIAAVTAKCKPEIEVFLHGALCVCHSGQCLFSSMVGGRSGNRGECAQPCRLPYNGEKSYPLSLTDLCLANHVKELCDSGVASLKIEGRMKSPEYVYTVTSIYRRLLDEYREATDKEYADLRAAFSRGGFTDKYFTGRIFDKMTGTRGEEDKEISRALQIAPTKIERKQVRAIASFALNKPSRLTLTDGEKTVTAEGATPRIAESHPLTELDLKNRLSKMGATYLAITPEDIELSLEEGINLSPAEINALRRDAAERFQSTEREPAEDTPLAMPHSTFNLPKKASSALFLLREAYVEAKKKSPLINEIDKVFLPLFSFEEGDGANGVYIPPVIMENEMQFVREKLKKAKNAGVLYALVGNIGHIPLAREFGLIPHGDFRLNIMNSFTRDAYISLGIEEFVLSPELTLPQARDIGGYTIHLGRIPLMLTERCFIKENFGCQKCNKAHLEDRMGERFPIIREFEHRNLILNSRLTYMGDKKNDLSAARLIRGHYIFSIESADEVARLLEAYKNGDRLPYEVRRLGKREFDAPKENAKNQKRKPQKMENNKTKSPDKSGAKKQDGDKLPLPRLLDPSHNKKPPLPKIKKIKK